MHTEEEIERAAEKQKATNKMLFKWAKEQAESIVKHMELKGHPLAMSNRWPNIRQGWIGGFISGVNAGFNIGFKTSTNLSKGVETGVETVLTENSPDVIQKRNRELKTLLGEAIGEASMCWTSPEKAGLFHSDKAEAIVDRLYATLATPLPEIKAEEIAVQESLPL